MSSLDILLIGTNLRVSETLSLTQRMGLSVDRAQAHVRGSHPSCQALWVFLDGTAPDLEALTKVSATRRVIHLIAGFERLEQAADQVTTLSTWALLDDSAPLVWVAETEDDLDFLARTLPMGSVPPQLLPPPLHPSPARRVPAIPPRVGLVLPDTPELEAETRALLERWADQCTLPLHLWSPTHQGFPSADEDWPESWAWSSARDFPPERLAALTDIVLFAASAPPSRLLARVALAGAPPILLNPGDDAPTLGLTPPPDMDPLSWVQDLARAPQTLKALAEDREARALKAHGPEAHAQRVQDVLGLKTRAPSAPDPEPTAKTPTPVLFIGTNGIGIGHVTRLLSVARRCPDSIRPVFATFSAATRLVKEAGYPCEHILSNEYAEADPLGWHAHVTREVEAILRYHQPVAIVYDGNVFYQGVADALAEAGRPVLWIHRGLYRPERGASTLERHKLVDLLIEPGELAWDEDQGPTRRGAPRESWPRRFARVPPVTWIGPEDRLPRDKARQTLGLPADGRAALIQVGAGNLRDTSRLVDRLVEILARWSDLSVHLAEWPITDRPVPTRVPVNRLRHYPMSPCLPAFDLVISATGYNSFHELMALGVPSLLVANEFTRIDDQEARARYAAKNGLAEMAKAEDTSTLAAAMERLLAPTTPPWHETVKPWPWTTNGASVIADWVTALAGHGDWPE